MGNIRAVASALGQSGFGWRLRSGSPFGKDAFGLIVNSLADLYDEVQDGKDDYDEPTTHSVCNVDFKGARVQVMSSRFKSLNELLESFDWNICLFGFENGKVTKHPKSALPVEFQELHLVCCTHPLSTLRRGFRFCERYRMKISNPALVQLCQDVLAKVICEDELEKEPELAVDV